ERTRSEHNRCAGQGQFGGGCLGPVYEKPEQCLTKLDRILEPFIYEGEGYYLPKAAYEDAELRKVYPSLQKLWDRFQDLRMLRSSRLSEWDFLSSQVGSNPWASLRV